VEAKSRNTPPVVAFRKLCGGMEAAHPRHQVGPDAGAVVDNFDVRVAAAIQYDLNRRGIRVNGILD